ncbi:MAG: 3-dehydroquinate synthase family protein [Sphingomicrobium sp.]
MHDLFEIASASGSHPVRIAAEPLANLAVGPQPTLILADSFFRDQLRDVSCPILFIEAVEESKELAALSPLIEQCREAGLARNGHILAVGGGVVQDIACFIATVYMRGVDWTFMPTTLLAMVDSCIGGKSSVNVGAFKNLVGSFYPPKAIIVPVTAVETLPPEHFAAGQCEAAKICFAHGNGVFGEYIALPRSEGRCDPEHMVPLSLNAKKWFIEVDEFDQNERLLLNFGHSFGHALESCTDYLLTHGVAVGIGCLAAVEMSANEDARIRDVARVQALVDDLTGILSQVPGIPEALGRVERGDFFRFWQSDKKHNPQAYRPILINDQGYLYRATLTRVPAVDDAIWLAFEQARDRVVGQALAR